MFYTDVAGLKRNTAKKNKKKTIFQMGFVSHSTESQCLQNGVKYKKEERKTWSLFNISIQDTDFQIC